MSIKVMSDFPSGHPSLKTTKKVRNIFQLRNHEHVTGMAVSAQ
jgi:hypothetical protein